MVAWLAGGDEPQTVEDASFNPGRLLTVRTRNSAAYKGIYALLMRGGCPDWLFEQQIDLADFHHLAIDVHHIFPKKWCNDQGVDTAFRESVVNKTPLARRTNGIISGRAPSRYLPLLEQQAGIDAAAMDDRLASHNIDPLRLRADDFVGFFAARQEALLDLIEHATGMEIPRDLPREVVAAEASDYEHELEELDDELEAVS